jgi:hypothetical protein
MQVGELPEHFTVFGIQSLDECGIVELGLAVRFAHVAKRVKSLQDGLAPYGRQLLPARKKRLPHVSLLLGSHLLPNLLAVAQSLLLTGSQTIPGLEALANLRLLFRRKAQEALVVPQELFLAGWRHILKPLNRLGGQLVWIAHWGQRVGQPGPQLRPRGGARWRTFLLSSLVVSLPVRGATQKSRRQAGGQNSPELESQLHYLVSFVTSGVDTVGGAGSSESASNLETTSKFSSTGKSRIMPKSDSVETWPCWLARLATDGFVETRGTEDSQTDVATSAVTAKASLGDGIQSQKLRRAGSAAIRARKDASNAGEGEIAGRSSSALQSARNSSARKRQEAH